MKHPGMLHCIPAYTVAFTPKGGCPLKRRGSPAAQRYPPTRVAFTPKGGCPLKRPPSALPCGRWPSSIHPQGWVPVETKTRAQVSPCTCPVPVAFTPKGGCPLKRVRVGARCASSRYQVAFTPKGGCPLKHRRKHGTHWDMGVVAFTPKGGCPLKPEAAALMRSEYTAFVAFTPKGGCPLKRDAFV